MIIMCLVIPALAQDQDKKIPIEVGLRLGSYTPSNIQTQPDGIYEKSGSLVGFDLTIGTHNPNLSVRISLDKMTLSGSYVGSVYVFPTYETLTIDAEFEMTGISAGVMFHTPRTEKVRVYGGLSLGSFSAKEDISISLTSLGSDSVSASSSAIGTNFFGGVLFGSPKFNIGIELSFLSVTMDNTYSGKTDLGGINSSLALNIGF